MWEDGNLTLVVICSVESYNNNQLLYMLPHAVATPHIESHDYGWYLPERHSRNPTELRSACSCELIIRSR
jgi:hypothetical protein